MIEYLVIFSTVAFLSFITFHLKEIYSLILFLLIVSMTVIFVGARWEVGTDWESYYQLYYNSLNVEHFDYGFVFLNTAVRYLNFDYNSFLLILSAITFGMFSYILIRYSKNYLVGYIVLIGHYGPINLVGSSRRAVAMSLVLLAIVTYANKKKFSSVWYVFVAAAFHKSAYISFLFMFVKNKLYDSSIYIILLLSVFLINKFNFHTLIFDSLGDLFLGTSLPFSVYFERYSIDNIEHYTPDNLNVGVQNLLSLFKKIVFLIIFYATCSKLQSVNRNVAFYFNVYFLGVMIYVLFIGLAILQMPAIYFLLIEIVLVGYSLRAFSYKYSLLIYIYFMISSYLSFSSAITLFFDLFYPYKQGLF